MSPVGATSSSSATIRGYWDMMLHHKPSQATIPGHAIMLATNVVWGGYEAYKMTKPNQSTGSQLWAAAQIVMNGLWSAMDIQRMHFAHKHPQGLHPTTIQEAVEHSSLRRG